MINTIVLIRARRFSKRDYERFGIDIFLKNGFKVKIIDITDIINPEIADNHKIYDEVSDNLIKLSDKKTAKETFEEFEDNKFVLLLLPFSFDRYWIYNSLSKSKAKIGVLYTNEPIKLGKDTIKKVNYYMELIKNYSLMDLIENLIIIIDRKFKISKFFMKPVDIVVAGGKKQINNIPYKIGEKTKICWTHTLDYDIYLKEKDIQLDKEEIAVFLDQYLPFHPDRIYGKDKKQINPEYYYSKLEEFFKLAEKELGLKVVIAAHPRSNYKDKTFFKDRKVVYGETSKLIKKSKVVIAHNSTALNFAILYKKPIIIIKLRILNNDRSNIYTNKFAELLGKKALTIDDFSKFNLTKELKINDELYEKYIFDYIKADMSNNNTSWKILIDEIKKI